MSSGPDDGPVFRRGVRLGVDWGAARIGVAACDADGLLAYPVETVPARDEAAAFDRLVTLSAEYEAFEVVLGLPVALNGRAGIAAQAIDQLAGRLAARLPVPLRLFDERLTTAEAGRHLGGLDTRRRRQVVDQAAAAGILESALSYERHTGMPPGRLIDFAPTKGEA